MKKIDLGQTIGILANVGVIAGIVFLAVELQQNNELLDAQARADRRDIARDAATREINNPDLRRAMVQYRDGEPLSKDALSILELEAQAGLTDWQYIYLEYRRGLLEEDALPILGWQRWFHEFRPMQECWSARCTEFHPVFVEWFEEHIANLD